MLIETRNQYNEPPPQPCFSFSIFIIILFRFIGNTKSTDTNSMTINAAKLLMGQFLWKCIHFLILRSSQLLHKEGKYQLSGRGKWIGGGQYIKRWYKLEIKKKNQSDSAPFPHFSALCFYRLDSPDPLHKTQTNVSIKPSKQRLCTMKQKGNFTNL